MRLHSSGMTNRPKYLLLAIGISLMIWGIVIHAAASLFSGSS